MPRLGSRVRASFSALIEILNFSLQNVGLRNFCASEWESLLSHNERSKKTELQSNAEIAQLVEHNLAKVGVASSSLVFRSKAKAQVAEW